METKQPADEADACRDLVAEAIAAALNAPSIDATITTAAEAAIEVLRVVSAASSEDTIVVRFRETPRTQAWMADLLKSVKERFPGRPILCLPIEMDLMRVAPEQLGPLRARIGAMLGAIDKVISDRAGGAARKEQGPHAAGS